MFAEYYHRQYWADHFCHAFFNNINTAFITGWMPSFIDLRWCHWISFAGCYFTDAFAIILRQWIFSLPRLPIRHIWSLAAELRLLFIIAAPRRWSMMANATPDFPLFTISVDAWRLPSRHATPSPSFIIGSSSLLASTLDTLEVTLLCRCRQRYRHWIVIADELIRRFTPVIGLFGFTDVIAFSVTTIDACFELRWAFRLTLAEVTINRFVDGLPMSSPSMLNILGHWLLTAGFLSNDQYHATTGITVKRQWHRQYWMVSHRRHRQSLMAIGHHHFFHYEYYHVAITLMFIDVIYVIFWPLRHQYWLRHFNIRHHFITTGYHQQNWLTRNNVSEMVT